MATFWVTESGASEIPVVNPVTHAFVSYPTATASSGPIGIAPRGGRRPVDRRGQCEQDRDRGSRSRGRCLPERVRNRAARLRALLQRRRLVNVGGPTAVAERVRIRRLPVAERRHCDSRRNLPDLYTVERRRWQPALLPGDGDLHTPGHNCTEHKPGR